MSTGSDRSRSRSISASEGELSDYQDSVSHNDSDHEDDVEEPTVKQNARHDKGLDTAPPPPEDFDPEITATRVNLTPDELTSFRAFARGTVAVDPTPRDKWFDSLPMVNDVSATAPRLNRRLKSKDVKISLTEGQAISIHQGLYSALNLLAIYNSTAVRGTADEVSYRSRAERVLSVLIHDVSVHRRVAALEALKIRPNDIPGVKRRRLDLIEAPHPAKDDEMIHKLFTEEMVQDVRDTIKKKEKESKKKPADSNRPRWVNLVPSQIPSPSQAPQPRQGKASATRSVASAPAPEIRSDASWPKFSVIIAPPLAGRTKFFAQNWELVTNDPWVLNTVEFGYTLPLRTLIPRQKGYRRTGPSYSPVILEETAKLCEKGAIKQIAPEAARFISPIFLVPKKDSSQRPVINLKKLNNLLNNKHFKMEGLLLVKDLLSPGAFMAKLDMKDAYFGISIKESHRKYLFIIIIHLSFGNQDLMLFLLLERINSIFCMCIYRFFSSFLAFVVSPFCNPLINAFF